MSISSPWSLALKNSIKSNEYTSNHRYNTKLQKPQQRPVRTALRFPAVHHRPPLADFPSGKASMRRKRRKTTESERWQSDAKASKDTLERLRSAHRAFTRVRNYAEERGFGELWRGVFRAPLFLFIFYICT